MNSSLVHAVVLHQQATFRAYFRALGEQDFLEILSGGPEALIEVLQCRYGCGACEARAAWNEFVLRYVDGESWTAARPAGESAHQPIDPWYPAADAVPSRAERCRLH